MHVIKKLEIVFTDNNTGEVRCDSARARGHITKMIKKSGERGALKPSSLRDYGFDRSVQTNPYAALSMMSAATLRFSKYVNYNSRNNTTFKRSIYQKRTSLEL